MSSNTSGSLRPTPPPTKAAIRTPLARARGLGSAHDGTTQFWAIRATGGALVPLSLAALWFVATYAGADYETTRAALRNPVFAISLLLFVLASIYHMRLGMKEILEDYVHSEGAKLIWFMLNSAFAGVVGLACIFSILKLSFGA